MIVGRRFTVMTAAERLCRQHTPTSLPLLYIHTHTPVLDLPTREGQKAELT